MSFFSHLYPCGSTIPSSHGHDDMGAFVLFYKGAEVFIDPGRLNYAKNEMGLYGKSARAHNAILVDGFAASPEWRNIYPLEYREVRSSVCQSESADKVIFKVTHDGFKRLSKDIKAAREFRITDEGFKIVDTIEGAGVHDVETLFHFGKEAAISIAETLPSRGVYIELPGQSKPFIFTISGDDFVLELVKGKSAPEPLGWCFPKYGQAEPVSTLIVRSKRNFPYIAEYDLKI